MGILVDQGVKLIVTTADNSEVNEFHILAGYTISQNTIYQNSRAETANLHPTNRNVGNVGTAAHSPASFSFTTYMDWKVNGDVELPDSLLWKNLLSSNTISTSATEAIIDFSNSSVAVPLPLNIWFEWIKEGTTIKLSDIAITRATISLDQDAITTIQWSGTALTYSFNSNPSQPKPPTVRNKFTHTNCLLNKLSILEYHTYYGFFNMANLPILTGDITIENNNTSYGRTILGKPKVDTGYVLGSIEVTVNVKVYLRAGYFGGPETIGTVMAVAYKTDYLAENFDNQLKINIGGATLPYVEFDTSPGGLGSLYLEPPAFSSGDTSTIDLTFKTKKSTDYPIITYKTQ